MGEEPHEMNLKLKFCLSGNQFFCTGQNFSDLGVISLSHTRYHKKQDWEVDTSDFQLPSSPCPWHISCSTCSAFLLSLWDSEVEGVWPWIQIQCWCKVALWIWVLRAHFPSLAPNTQDCFEDEVRQNNALENTRAWQVVGSRYPTPIGAHAKVSNLGLLHLPTKHT